MCCSAANVHERHQAEGRQTASKKTTKIRTQQLGEHRHLISGGSEMFLLQDEVKMCTPAEYEQLLVDLQKGGIKVTNQALALAGMW